MNRNTGTILCNNCFTVPWRIAEDFDTVDWHELMIGETPHPLFCDRCHSIVRHTKDISECIECTLEFANTPDHELPLIRFLALRL